MKAPKKTPLALSRSLPDAPLCQTGFRVRVMRMFAVALGAAAIVAASPASAARYLDEVFACNTWNTSGSGTACQQKLDIVYGTALDENNTGATIELKLDRRAPPASDTVTNRPVIVWAHGGGFTGGGKGAESFLVEEWTRRGFVTASIDYRLCPACKIPAPLSVWRNAKYDMQMAVRYIRDNAVAWGIDPDKIVAAGFSAGGSMTLGVAYDSADDNDSGPTSSAVAAGIDQGQGTDDEGLLHLADPGEPPLAILVGGNDYPSGGSGFPAAQSLYQHLRSKRIDAELSEYPLGTHYLVQDQNPFISDFLERSSEFLYRRLPLDPSITSSTPQAFVSQTDLRFAGNTSGTPDPQPKTITITNVGGGTLNWSITGVPSRVVVTPTSGSGLQRGESSTLTVEVQPVCCGAEGTTYSKGAIAISTTGAAVTTHAVNVYIKATNTPAIQLRERVVFFSTNTDGLPTPPLQTVTVENVGGGTLNWAAADSEPWISESNQTGTSLGAGAFGSFQVSVAPAGETTCRVPGIEKLCGPYDVTVSAPGASSQATTVALYYADRARIATSPTEMHNYLPANGQVGTTSRFVVLTNKWGGTLTWQATHTCGAGMTIVPSSGSLASNASQTVEVRNTWNPGTVVGAYGGCLVTISDSGSSPAAVTPSETIAVLGVATD